MIARIGVGVNFIKKRSGGLFFECLPKTSEHIMMDEIIYKMRSKKYYKEAIMAELIFRDGQAYIRLKKPLPLNEAVKSFGTERLHPLDRRLEEELPEKVPFGMSNYREMAIVTMVKAK